MSKLKIDSVSIAWSVSRGRDTYGWNICRATSHQTGSEFSQTGGTYRTIGGGYDMIGTVIGDWFAAEYQAELQTLIIRDQDKLETYAKYSLKHSGLYGLFIRPDGTVYLDGACGIESMLRIIEACGFEHQRQYNPRTKSKVTTGYLISKVVGE